MIKGVFQSCHLKTYIITIVIEQQLGKSALYDHRCFENIKTLYKSAQKCYGQQKYKAIIESSIVSTPEGLSDNSPMDMGTSKHINIPCSWKSPNKISKILNVKHKTYFCRLGDAKTERKAIITGSDLWSNISKREGIKINSFVNKHIYDCIFNNPHVLQSPISND